MTARSSGPASPITYQGAMSTSKVTPGARRRTRAISPVDELGQVDRLDHVGQRLVAGQLDQVADQGGELLDLGVHVLEQLGARLGREPARRSASAWRAGRGWCAAR